MSKLLALFSEHPRSVGEGYFQHLVAALKFSATLVLAAGVCAVHAVLPFLFKRTGGELVQYLHKAMIEKRRCSASKQMQEESH